MARGNKPTPEIDRLKIITDICQRMSSTGKGLATILRDDATLPAYSTIQDWLSADADLTARYARAREDTADFLADEIVAIADDDSLDYGHKEDGTPYIVADNIQRSKLRVDARKWVASKLKPRSYGERVAVEHDVGGSLAEELKAARMRVENMLVPQLIEKKE